MKEEDQKEDHSSHSTLKKKSSFKNSFARLKSDGSMTRPYHRTTSAEKDRGMTDKLHDLMASYIPKDIPSIQKG